MVDELQRHAARPRPLAITLAAGVFFVDAVTGVVLFAWTLTSLDIAPALIVAGIGLLVLALEVWIGRGLLRRSRIASWIALIWVILLLPFDVGTVVDASADVATRVLSVIRAVAYTGVGLAISVHWRWFRAPRLEPMQRRIERP